MLDYGYRSKCCLAPIRVGRKKIRKTNEVITVWVCCICKSKDIRLISREDANKIRKSKETLHPEIDDDQGFSDDSEA